MLDWDSVYDSIVDCRGIAFDTCHKIYVLMDDEQIVKMREYEYDPLITIYDMGTDEMFATVKGWYEDSCMLRFVEAVATMPEGTDPNEGFTTLIGQGDTDDEECEDCLEIGCYGACDVDRCEKCGATEIYEDDMCKWCYDDSQEEDED